MKNSKQIAAQASLEYIENGDVVGVGTGSTVNFFIDELAKIKTKIDGSVASSLETARRLEQHGIRVFELNHVGNLPIYIDGTDEATRHLHLIKGGQGALTREKIVAEASTKFVCIAEQRKLVERLGTFPVPIEVLPMAQSLIGRRIAELGALPKLRDEFTTDNGNIIIDAHNLVIDNPIERERQINQMPGVVSVGIFALRGADILLLGKGSEIEVLHRIQ